MPKNPLYKLIFLKIEFQLFNWDIKNERLGAVSSVVYFCPSVGVRYQYFAAPATPTKSSSASTTSMGSIAFMTSGATLYNPLSGTDGSLASYYEWSTLDPCYGHSSQDKQYHYHAV
jgi:hypothetical protein